MQIKKSSYRQRGFKLADGSVEIIYGSETPDLVGEGISKEWDNLVTETSSSQSYIEATAGPISGNGIDPSEIAPGASVSGS